MDKNNTGFQEDADLYSILNVSSNASKKEISTSFKKLSVSFHADKQNSEDLK
jgi:DnaJ-class molecular chaperone